MWLKRALALGAFAVVLYLFWPLTGEMRTSAGLISQAAWGWLGVAALLQAASYVLLGMLNAWLLKPFTGQIRFPRLLALLTAMAFIEVAVPTAGASGAVLRARLLGRAGYSAEASTFTLAMEYVYLGMAMLAVALAGLGYLAQTADLAPRAYAALAGLVMALAAAGVVILWLGRDRERGRAGALWAARAWNAVVSRWGRLGVSLELVRARADAFYAATSRLAQGSPVLFLAAAAGRVTLDVATLGACFLAFGYRIPAGTLLTAYGAMLLLSGLAALPGGLGLTEASLAVVFSRLGTPGAVAIASALVYRLLAFWLVRFVGFVAWQGLEAQR